MSPKANQNKKKIKIRASKTPSPRHYPPSPKNKASVKSTKSKNSPVHKPTNKSKNGSNK